MIRQDISLENIDNLLLFLEKTFDFDTALKYNLQDMQESIFLENIDKNLDVLMLRNQTLLGKLEQVTKKINELIAKANDHKNRSNGSNLSNLPDFASVEKLEKEGHYIAITKIALCSYKMCLKKRWFLSMMSPIFSKIFISDTIPIMSK